MLGERTSTPTTELCKFALTAVRKGIDLSGPQSICAVVLCCNLCNTLVEELKAFLVFSGAMPVGTSIAADERRERMDQLFLNCAPLL
jgi:hypothetical protein